VHGEWIPAPGGGMVTFRRQRPKAAPEGGYAGRMWTIERLQCLAEEYSSIGRGLADLVSDFMGLPRSSSLGPATGQAHREAQREAACQATGAPIRDPQSFR
jgi:hypothetical protein